MMMSMFAWMLMAGGTSPAAPVHSSVQVKAVFLTNFVRFVNWPETKLPEKTEPWIIGIVGEDAFGETLQIVARKTVKGRKLVVRRFKREAGPAQSGVYPDLAKSGMCHVAFVAPSEQPYLSHLLPMLESHAVLTVGEGDEFLESGGMIAFVGDQTKGQFEVHLKNARKAGLEIQAQLLRLARDVKGKVVEDVP
jgi:hypothetical protein